MQGVSQIIKSRQRRYIRQNRILSKRLGLVSIIFLIIFSLILSSLVIASSILYSRLLVGIPSPTILPQLIGSADEPKNHPTKIYDRSAEHLIAVLENTNARGQKYLVLEGNSENKFPDSIVSAMIASTEPNYWNNPGITLASIRDENQPTIAQKLSRIFLFEQGPPSLQRLIQENILAAQLISTYGHQQALEWYLNTENFGNFAYGVDAASRVYFGKPATEISIAEAAMLAAIANSPGLNPFDSPSQANQMKDLVLQQMFEQGLISSDQLEESLAKDIVSRETPDLSLNLEPAFTDLVINQASSYIPSDQIYRGGLEIITTLDYDLQTQTDCTIKAQVGKASEDPAGGQSQPSLENCEMGRLLPSMSASSSATPFPISANVLILDPREGQILAFVADGSSQLNQRSILSHPPGTILSPLLYLSSFSRGSSPATMVWDIPANIPSTFTDLQSEVESFNGPVSLRSSLANDYMGPALQILNQMGTEQVWHDAERLGLTNLQLPEVNGENRILFEDGAAEISELSQVYGVFANQGILAGIAQNNASGEDPNSPINPQVILKVLDEEGNEVLDCTDPITTCQTTRRPVTTKELAYLVTDILKDETARWPSLGHPNPLEIGRPAAAKMGTSNNKGEIWTIGYTPELLTTVWVGPGYSSQDNTLNPELATGLWHAVMQYASKDLLIDDFAIPPSINDVEVCYPSGLLPSEDCPKKVDEIFIQGNEPSQTDNLFKTFLINQESGRLATIFTPPGLIKKEVFMAIPPEAEQWAESAGLPLIPTDYDIIDLESDPSEDAQIHSPAMFSTVKGVVPIIGRAAGEGFQAYRLQVGPGLNPVSWYQIGDERNDPVPEGQLGAWDTHGLSGLFVLQLIVSYENDRVETSIVQVTVDNQEPSVNIRFPEDGQSFNQQDLETISLQVEAGDNLLIDRVEFFINGDLAATLNSAPYVIPWKLTTGEHILRVVAYDQAGNRASDRVKILVE